jgi:methionyl-tRNA synthetase
MHTTLACCLECLKVLALVSSPIIPEAAQKIWELLGYESKLEELNWNEVLDTPLPVGRQLPAPAILFKKVEDEQVAEEVDRLATRIQA